MGTNNNSTRIIKDVYWPEKMKVYFEQTMRATPSQFRNFASGTLVREVEDKARERNASEVSEQDLVKAFLDSIPVFFRGDMVKLLKDLGIDISRPKEESAPVNNIPKMKEDIIKSANLAGVSYNEMLMDKILKAYEVSFSGMHTCISFGTTTRRVEHRGLSIYIVDVYNQFDPFEIAKRNQLLVNHDSPIELFVQEVKKHVQRLGFGLEFGVMTGMEQINVMCATHIPQTVEQVLALGSAPDSLRANIPFLKKYQLQYLSVVGVNYLKNMITFQFVTNQISNFNVEYIESMLEELGYKVPAKTILEICLKAVLISIDFSATKKQPDSISFKMCANSIDEVPKNLNSFVENYAVNAPFRSDKKKYTYIITFTRSGQFLKIQNDYSGTSVDSLSGPFNQRAYGKDS